MGEINPPAPQPTPSGGYQLPSEMYSVEQLAEVYLPKGKEQGNEIANLEYDSIFVPLIDHILGGESPRECAKWLRNTHSKNIHPNAIDKYIRDFIPNDIREQIRICSDTFKNSKVDPLREMEDLVREQKKRLKDAYAEAKKNTGFKFNFGRELELFFKMNRDLLMMQQSVGKAPKVPERKEVVTRPGPSSQTVEESLNQSQIARVLSILEKIESSKQETLPTEKPKTE